MKLLLASESIYRKALLQRLRIAFDCASHGVDERAVERGQRSLAEHALHLAARKADSLAEEWPEHFILASDQVAALGESMLSKPGSVARAVQQLRTLSGNEHQLHTAMVLRRPDGSRVEHLDTTSLTMRELSQGEIERYVAADEPLDCGGSYKIESLGISLFESIEGADFTAITGLPLIELSKMLRAEGFAIP